eukprot:Skav214795  [mRNA]  locus=scaffold3850:80671:90559:+ [translate_table: standard]
MDLPPVALSVPRLRSALRGHASLRSPRSVQFLDVVDLVLWDDTEVRSLTTCQCCLQGQCRHFWHLHGQLADAERIFHIVARWQLGGPPCFACGVGGSALSDPYGLCLGRSPVEDRVRLEDWTFSGNSLPFWIPITLSGSEEAFHRSCVATWFDFLTPGETVWLVPVTPPPSTWRSTVAHVLIIQGNPLGMVPALLQCTTAPPFAQWRAVLHRSVDTVAQLFDLAQCHSRCLVGSRLCHLEGPTLPRAYAGEEIAPIDDGALLIGAVMEIEASLDGSPVNSDDEASDTTLPSDGSICSDIESGSSEVEALHDSDATAMLPLSTATSAPPRPLGELAWDEVPFAFRIDDVCNVGNTPPSWVPVCGGHSYGSAHDEDATVLMQRAGRSSATSSTDLGTSGPADLASLSHSFGASDAVARSPSGSQTWMVFLRPDDYFTFDLPTAVSLPSVSDVARLVDLNGRFPIAVHRIRGTVFELLPEVQPVILQCASDPHSAINLRLALVDIVLERSGAVTPRLLRRVVALPPQLTRHDLLRALHIHMVCDGHDLCRLFLDDVLWLFEDPAAHDVHHGSYVLLRLPFELRDQHGQALCDFYIDEGLSLCPSLALLAANGSSVSPMSSLPSDFDPAIEFPDGVAPDQLSPSPSMGSQSFSVWRFQAWFVRHGTLDVCRGMRPLELWPDFARWRNSIEGAWHDVLDPTIPFSIHLVHPQPTAVTPGFPNIPHLIIEQDTPVGYCAILVSVVALDEQALPFQQQLALSVPAFGPTNVLLHLLGLDDMDDRWQLTIHVGDAVVTADGLLDLLTGQLVVLTLRSPGVSRGSSEPEAEDVDDHSLLALGSLPLGSPPVVQLAVHKHVINIDEGSQEADQWLPPAMRPGAAGDNGTSSEGPPIGSVDAFLEWWHTLDFEDGDPQRQAPEFLTYFLHGRRVPTCRDARWVIPLPPLSPESLMARFRQCWTDLVDHDAPIFVFPVFPQPPDLRPHRPVIHVLLLQEPLDLFSPMLLSKQVQDDMWSHAAFLIATPTHRFAALMLAEVAPLCFRATMVMDCEALVGDSVLTSTAVQHVPPGLNIKVTVHERLPDGPLPAILSLGAAEIPVPLQVAMDMATQAHPDRYVPIHTWYIDHRRWQVCEQPRTLVLQPSALEAWLGLAQNLWADRVVPSRSIQVSVVAPHPGPRAAVPNSMHVILEQSELRYEPRIPLLISSLVTGFETFQAVSVEPRMSCNSLVWFAGLDDCQPLGPRPCKCVFGAQEFVHDHPFMLDPGSFVRILPGLPAMGVPTDDDDSGSLLQLPSASALMRPAASPPVQLCLDALIESGPHQRQKTRLCDSAPSLHWFQHASWRQRIRLRCLPGGAGWAVIVVLDSLDGEFFLGCVWGRVQLDTTAPDWVGAREPDNIAAELSAALYALYLGLRLPFALPVFLCPDLAFSLDLCQQTCVTSTPNARLAQMVRVVYSWHVECGLDKIAGHSHHPWNDLADTLAKFAIHHSMDSAPFVIEPLHELALEPHDLAWVWQQQMAPSYAQCVPALLEGQFHQFRPCWQSIHVPDVASPVRDLHHERLSLQLVSANVLALDRLDLETLPTRRSAERTMRLDSQMHLRGVHILGIQEARTPPGRYESDHYIILASGADHSHSACLGCELFGCTRLASASQVLYDHDVSFAHDDHVPVWAQLDGACVVEPLAVRYRWDPDKMQDPQTASNSHRREVIARGSAARQSWGPLARSFYGHRAVSTPTKAKVFHALSLSRFVFQAHVWCGVTAKELQSWTSHLRAPLLQLLRRPLHGLRAFELSTPVLAGLLGVLPPADLLHVARLRYFGRFLRMCPPMLWHWLSALFQSGLGWLSDCLDSFRWLTTFYRAASLPSADAPLADWVTWVRLDAAWKGRIRTAATQCLRYHQRLAEHQVWQVRFRQTLAQAQVQLPSDVPAPPSPEWCCEVCSATFGSRRALATHAYKVHGYRAEVRYYGDTGLCNACGLLFHDRARLHRHLLGSSDCFDTLRATAPPLTEAEVDDLDEAARTRAKELKQQGWLPTKALVAVQQTYGPLLPSPTEPAAREMYRRRALRAPTPGHRFRCLEGRRIDAAPSGASVWWTSSDIPPLVFQSTGGAQVGGGALAMGSLAREAARLHVRALTFVHFFSGFRRPADLQDILEHTIRPDGTHVFVISVDICLQKHDANLASSQSLAWWRRRIHDGFVFGAGGGPPCETWSAARLFEGGPPPLRTAQDLWGLPTLTSRQSTQVLIGTRLLQFLWTILVDLALAGGCGFCEHPQYKLWAAEQRPASIWITEPSRLLRGLACFQAVSYDQCVYGAVAIKPTTLLLLRMPSFRIQTLCAGRMGRCHHGRAAHEGLAGLQDDGAFKTSRCKVYPEAMNRALSRAIHSFVDVTFADCSLAQVLPVEFQPYRATAFASEADVQKDYYPEAAGD